MNKKDDLKRFMSNAHIFARLVENVLEWGYLREAVGTAVTFDQISILKFLTRDQRSHVKDVAGFLNASYAAASKMVSRLVKKKLVHSVTFGEDRRAELLTVTPRGQALIDKYEAVKVRRLTRLLRDENLDSLSGGLERAIDAVLKDRPEVGNPCLGCGAYYAPECVAREKGQDCPCAPKA